MKSRISFFDKTLFRKNLTRFAPAWGLYIVCMLMGLLIMLDGNSAWWLPQVMGDCIQVMCVITPCYALLVAQLLFGDLFNSRMCNAIHALPLRRETIFMTNLASGLVFHLIPTGIMAALSAIIMALGSFEGGWVTGPWWLLGVNLQFLCFFGIGILSAQLVGSRFAMVVIYGIFNFFSIIVFWLMDTLYMPMFFGVQLNMDAFTRLCPVAHMMSDPFVYVERIYPEVYISAKTDKVLLGECFGYYFICAAIGLALMALALELYRRRNLECAGDFIAFRVVEPVFHVIYSLIVGAVFSFVIDDLFGHNDGLLFLFIGLGIGWFTGRMLLLRSPRVFQKKGFLGCGALMGIFGLTLILAAMDPLGIVTWVPRAEQVRSVTISDSYRYHNTSRILEDPADIEAVIAMHKSALEERNEYAMATPLAEASIEEYTSEVKFPEFSAHTIPITIDYRLRSGRTVTRYYHIWNNNPHGENLYHWFSEPAFLFGENHDLASLTASCSQILVQDNWEGTETFLQDEARMRGLLEAILADCEEGTMVQDWEFQQGHACVYWIYLYQGTETQELTIFSSCDNTLNYLRAIGFPVDELMEKMMY